MHTSRGRLLFQISIAVILLGLLIFFRTHSVLRFARTYVVAGFNPVIRSAMVIREWGNEFAIGGNREQRVSEERLGALVAVDVLVAQLTRENERLRSAFGFKERNNLHIKGASVRYYGTELGHEFLLVESENLEGVEKGSLVIDANGLLIGSVKEKEDFYAKVSVASNPEDVYEVTLLPSGTNAFAKGLGNRTFSLELLVQDAVIRKGDFIVLKGQYKTIVVGEVVKMSLSGTGAFKEVRAVLVARPDSHEEVFIIISGNK